MSTPEENINNQVRRPKVLKRSPYYEYLPKQSAPSKTIPMQPRQTATSNQSAPPAQATLATDQMAGNIDKIRSVIFGDQMRDYDKKFNRLEERMTQDITDLREETREHFSSLEAHITRELDSLVNRLRTEQDERTTGAQEMQRELRQLTQDLDQKLSQLDNSTSETQRDLRQQILDQSKSLREEMRQKFQEMIHCLENESEELKANKVGRALMANLLTEMAVRLNNEFEMEVEG